MKKILANIATIVMLTVLLGCSGGLKKNQSPIKEPTDAEYPDNNDIEGRSSKWDRFQHDMVQIDRISKNNFKVTFPASNELSDTIVIENINLLEWMPTIPDYVAKDDYLTHIGIINAEWNRQQVKFEKGEFSISMQKEEGPITVRVDLARNCLNSYLWEIITFTSEDGKQKPMYHGWFDFPHELYEELFDEVNEGKLTFNEYRDYLVQYKDPDKK